jgi:aryl-alcohol dehydrogenase-like predicted oxidoreductase
LPPSSQRERENETKRSDQSPHAHRYGIRAFDTSPYYDNSEIVVGTALKTLESEFPRTTYRLLTKVGRYGPINGSDPGPADFDYSPATIRRSVRRSLQRLHTQYLDVVYLHDIEFVSPCVAPRTAGNHLSALGAEAAAYGLTPERDFSSGGEGGGTGSMGTISAAGSDERILEAVAELRALQAEGLIRQVGICGPSVRPFPFPHSLTVSIKNKNKAYPYPASFAPRSSS